MRRIARVIAVATSLGVLSTLLSSPAIAKTYHSFENTIAIRPTEIQIKVVLSEDLAFRADNIPDDCERPVGVGGPKNAFHCRGYLGNRDLERLSKRLQTQMAKRLAKRGITVTEDADTVLNLVVEDLSPNSPTFKQKPKSRRAWRDQITKPGAHFTGSLTEKGGKIGELCYFWYDTRGSRLGITWSDANLAIDRFTKKTAKVLNPE